MSTSNAETYRKVSEFYRELKKDGAYYTSFDALDYMYQAALEKLENTPTIIGKIDNETILNILNNHFANNGLKFVMPDGNVLPTIRIKVLNTKYVKDDSSISLTDEFYNELDKILKKYGILDIQWNNGRTSFWWNFKK